MSFVPRAHNLLGRKKRVAEEVDAAVERKKKKKRTPDPLTKDLASLDVVDDLLQFMRDDETQRGEKKEEEVEQTESGDEELTGFDVSLADVEGERLEAAELEVIRQRDPVFCKYLEENNSGIFAQMTSGMHNDADEEEEEEKEKDKEGGGEDTSQSTLTVERYHHIRSRAVDAKTFGGFQLLLAAFRTAIHVGLLGRTENIDEACGVEERKLTKKSFKERKRGDVKKGDVKKAATSVEKVKRKVPVRLLFKKIWDDEEESEDESTPLHLLIVEDTLEQLPKLLDVHAGSGKPSKPDAAPLEFKHWDKVHNLMWGFWQDTTSLVERIRGNNEDTAFTQKILRLLSQSPLLRWVMPYERLRSEFLQAVERCWAFNTSEDVRIHAFLIIRTFIVVAADPRMHVLRLTAKPLFKRNVEQVRGATVGDTPISRSLVNAEIAAQQVVQGTIATTYKCFESSIGHRGFNWRRYPAVKLLMNCCLELLRVESSATYRVGFLAIRQLGLLVRNACIAQTAGGAKGGAATTMKGKKGKVARQKANQLQETRRALFNFQFIMCSRLWAQAIGEIPQLRPLAFPLCTVVGAALKMRLSSVEFSPFSLHCLGVLTRLSASLGAFIPLGSYFINLGASLVSHQNSAHRDALATKGSKTKAGEEGRKSRKKKKHNAARLVKPIDVDLLCRLPPSQAKLVETSDALIGRWHELLLDHLGLLSLHPSFPEVSVPLVQHLRKLSKMARADATRIELRELLRTAEETVDVVRTKRFSLDPTTIPLGRLVCLRDNDVPMATKRTQMLKQRQQFVEGRIAAELKREEEEKEEEDEEKEDDGSEEAEEEDDEEEDDDAVSNEEDVTSGLLEEDEVEELVFSSSDEEA